MSNRRPRAMQVNLSYRKLDDAAAVHLMRWLLPQRSRITKLTLHFNKIRQIPDCIGELRNLEELNLSYNLLTELPESMGRLKKLRILTLQHNGITYLPSCIALLPAIQALDLYKNPLTFPPAEVVELGLEEIQSYLLE